MAHPATTKKLKLQFPVEWQGAAVTELTVRRPKGKDLRWLPKGETGIEEMYPLLALLAGIEEGLIDEMDAADVAALNRLVNGFLNPAAEKAAKAAKAA